MQSFYDSIPLLGEDENTYQLILQKISPTMPTRPRMRATNLFFRMAQKGLGFLRRTVEVSPNFFRFGLRHLTLSPKITLDE